MEKERIPVRLVGNRAETPEKVLELGYAGNQGVYQLVLETDQLWQGLSLRTVWRTSGGRNVAVDADRNGLVEVPAEATRHATGAVPYTVTFVGVDTEGMRRVSCQLEYVVKSSGPVQGSNSHTPTPDEVDWMLAATEQVRKAADTFLDVVPQAEKLRDTTAEYVKKAENHEQTAEKYNIAAENEAHRAGLSAQAASEAAAQSIREAAKAQEASSKAKQEADRAGCQAKEEAQKLLSDGELSPLKTWSSEAIIREMAARMCEPFEMEGLSVTCHPVPEVELEMIGELALRQKGKGKPSPQNIRAFQPWEKTTLYQVGTNHLKVEGREMVESGDFFNTTPRQLNGNKVFVGISPNGYYLRKEVKEYELNENWVSVVSSSDASYGIGLDFPVRTGMMIHFNHRAAKGVALAFYDADGCFMSFSYESPQKVPDGACWGMLVFVSSGPEDVNRIENPMVTEGEESALWQPYRKNEWIAAFGEEHVSGRFCWKTGEMLLDHKKVIMDGKASALAGVLGTNQGGTVLFAEIPGINRKRFAPATACSHFDKSGLKWTDMPLYSFGGDEGSANTICFVFPTGTTVEQGNLYFKEQLEAGTPVEINLPMNEAESRFYTAQCVKPLPNQWANTLYSEEGTVIVRGWENMRYTLHRLSEHVWKIENARTMASEEGPEEPAL